MNKITSVLLVLVLCACNFKKTKNNPEIKKIDFSESTRAKVFQDADKRLPDWSKTNTVLFQVLQIPKNLHPLAESSGPSDEFLFKTQIYLMKNDPGSFEAVPSLSSKKPEISENQLNFTYIIKSGQKWDNGDPVTAEDVLFTMKANTYPLVENPYNKFLFKNISDVLIDKKNNQKITIKFKKRHFLNSQLACSFPILQKKIFDPEDILAQYSLNFLEKVNPDDKNNFRLKSWVEEINKQKYGTEVNFLTGGGNYYVESWIKEKELVLRKKENCATSSGPEKIIYRVITEPVQQFLSLKNGDIDVSTTLDTRTLAQLSKENSFNKNYNYALVESLGFSFIALNSKPDPSVSNPIFKTTYERQALAYLIPYDELNEIAFLNQNSRAAGPVSKFKKEFNPKLKIPEFNPEKAMEILKREGWEDSDQNGILDKRINNSKREFTFELLYYNTSPTWHEMACLIKNSLEKYKIKTKLICTEPQQVIKKLESHTFDAYLGARSESSLPEDFFKDWHTSQWENHSGNHSGFGNVETDQLIDSLEESLGERERIAISHQLQSIITKEKTCIFLFQYMRRIVIHKRWGQQLVFHEKPYVFPEDLRLIP